jgi:superoxide dismutase, Cu-Zn family
MKSSLASLTISEIADLRNPEKTMKWKNVNLALALIALASPLAASEVLRAHADLLNTDGDPIGQAELLQGPTGTLIRIELEGLPAGPKAIHIHGNGDCTDHCEGFAASGGHLNPDGREHGLLNAEGPDPGDLPNFYVHENGRAWAEFHTTAASLDGQFGARILDPDGAALVIHENPDDHLSQPIGGAGARLACGVIVAMDQPE